MVALAVIAYYGRRLCRDRKESGSRLVGAVRFANMSSVAGSIT